MAVFNSHCAREGYAARLAQGPAKLLVAEIKGELAARGLPTTGVRCQPKPWATGRPHPRELNRGRGCRRPNQHSPPGWPR